MLWYYDWKVNEALQFFGYPLNLHVQEAVLLLIMFGTHSENFLVLSHKD